MNAPRIFLALSLSLAAIALGARGVLAQAPPSLEQIERRLEARVKAGAAASLVVSVRRHGEVLWERAFGFADVEAKRAATLDTAYSLASISKPITATAIMILVERGKIDLDRPIDDYLGDAKLRVPIGDRDAATVRRVLDHTAGLPLHYHFFYADEDRSPPSMETSIARYGVCVRPPGERYEYSNFGYGILGYVVERVSGVPFREFLAREIFRPLGMTDSALGLPGADASRAAVRYLRGHEPLPFYDFDHPGASAVYASARDLARFGRLHVGRNEGDRAILRPETIERMRTPVQGGYALGWAIRRKRGRTIVQHSGGMGGVATLLTVVPADGLVIVALANSGTTLPRQATVPLLRRFMTEAPPATKSASSDASSDAPNEASNEAPNDASTAKPEPKPARRGAARAAIPSGRPRGRFVGVVHTPGHPVAQVRLELALPKFGRVKARLGDAPAQDVRLRYERGFIRGRLPGTLTTADLAGRHDLRLDLRWRGDRITGRLTAFTRPKNRVGSALSHWVDLRRDPNERD